MSETREVGRTRDTGWEIGVSHSFDCPLEQAWNVLPGAGLALWLGSVDALPTGRCDVGSTAEGATFEIRSVRPLDRIRMVWAPSGGGHALTCEQFVRRKGFVIGHGSHALPTEGRTGRARFRATGQGPRLGQIGSQP